MWVYVEEWDALADALGEEIWVSGLIWALTLIMSSVVLSTDFSFFKIASS